MIANGISIRDCFRTFAAQKPPAASTSIFAVHSRSKHKTPSEVLLPSALTVSMSVCNILYNKYANLSQKFCAITFELDGTVISLSFPLFKVDGTIFVSIPFFREVFGMNNTYVMDGTEFINNDEVME